MSWYRTGTVAVTNGSKTVTGVGTLWTTAVNAGDAFALVDANLNPTGAWYEVDVVVSNTEITLKQSYAGTTGSNKQFCVFNMVGNMTTPSFAQRLATFFASFQSLIDKPTTTPTAASIPIADANGDIDSGWIPATFFNKTNILGTVSQVDGVPTGAVIESGTNANGTYTKFADGTMICSKNLFNPGTPLQLVYMTDLYMYGIGWVFPAPFYDENYFAGGCGTDQDSIFLGFNRWEHTNTTVNMYMFTTSSTLSAVDITFLAIGRWF